MAIVDANTVLSDYQEITATTYSQRTIDFQTPADYGSGTQNLYVHFMAQGAHAKDLRIQILGLLTEDDATPLIIGDSGVIKKTDLVAGSDGYIQVLPNKQKWRYLKLRYIPTTDGTGTETVTGSEKPDLTNFNQPRKVGEEPKVVANAIRAQLESVAVLGTVYPFANEDKSYTA
jgi:hypothetical protein|nr:MAG TPA: major capsid protein [Caudoviricetes sp.]